MNHLGIGLPVFLIQIAGVFGLLAIIAVPVVLIWWVLRGSGKRMFCLTCGSISETRRVMPGSLAIEVVAWCLFLLPGLIYSLWRHSAAFSGCGHCRSRQVVPVTSPVVTLDDLRRAAPSPSFRP